MTMPIRFDTQQYINTLIQGGHTPEQAAAQAHALGTALAEGTVASSELLMVKMDLLARMDVLKAELQGQIKALRGLVMLSLAVQAAEAGALLALLHKLYS